MASQDSESKAQFYSRKEKSLGVLCSNFLKLYNRDGVESIGLDSAATQLGVERRRIYDIVNILESVGVLARKAKNQYYWRGFKAIPQALEELRKQVSEGNFDCNKFRVSKEASDSYKLYDPRIVTGENDHGGSSNSSTDRQAKPSTSSKDNRKEKSLGLLTQNFIKLFLSSDAEMISLDTAATALLGDLHDPTAMRTKVRRLYDIANVFSSMDLIEKVRHPESGKPAFKWLGTKGNSKKRVFGTDLTNTVLKKPQVDSSSDLKRKVTVAMYTKSDLPKDECDENLRTHNSPHSSKDFVFGPFTPLNNVHARGASRNKKPRQRQDWENLASTYRPQYRNQAIDDLFGHYVDAWKSWHVKAEEEKPMQPVA